MNAVMPLHTSAASDPGHQRANNEDRIWVDETRGIFLVADGLGGHLAGETAAEIAVQVISEQLASLPAVHETEQKVQEAIVAANNRIFELAQTQERWAGMACVVTLAVVQDDYVTVGHVGDSRLYMIRNGIMHKVTSDHSPVGEWEDCGVLTEEEAMRHPRRHEVFRDLGAQLREYDDQQFVQIRHFPFPTEAALLLCTDGLTDSITTSRIKQILGEYRGDPEVLAGELIAAANEAGGKDNISVIFAAGPDFRAGQQFTPVSSVDPHSITRMRTAQSRWKTCWLRLPWVLLGVLLGALLGPVLAETISHRPAAPANRAAPTRVPTHISVDANDPRGVISALNKALPGDVIEVPPGDYLGPIVLKDQVSILGSLPRRTTIRSDPSSPANQGVVITAHRVHNTRVENLEVISDKTHPLRIGMAVVDSSVQITNCKISGAIETGIGISGVSDVVLIADVLSGNAGTGLTATGGSTLHMVGNWFTDNGRVTGMPKAGVEIAPTVKLEAMNNIQARNGLAKGVPLPGSDNLSLSGK